MANCHSLFSTFNGELQITSTKRANLIKSKDALRKAIIKWFKENHPEYVPKFWIQGSYKMKTVIRTKDDMCDLDDGIYFLCEPDVTPATLQNWVYQAVCDHTKEGATRHRKCVRVHFAKDYQIDLPIYKKADGDDHPWLCVKGGTWAEEQSDPKEFVEWYDEERNHQLTRIIRYLKSWGDTVRHNMLSGLAMTLVAQANYDEDDRDDQALYNILVAIRSSLKSNWQAKMPTTPGDDILAEYDHDFRDRFFSHLDSFIEDAKNALEQESEKKASNLWRKHLGKRFPEGEDDDAKTDNVNRLKEVASRGTVAPYWGGKVSN
ncbi:cyclic GMP-AMP synthase DncV-like nucleotidyltransferase [Neolewinella agarilytica]|uniref:Cyclic GMP-AMP synthase n=1 Tax=Neolewinella agarilytica TaxID=478744 RepID=A0A1H9HDA5_9BACT|nr:hypothetical protein [Neolewinella agarilytica]SEQ60292.1 hypothetical protein SAMN05444359_112113 [Neolewinella agarilytica]